MARTILDLNSNPKEKERIEKRAYDYGRFMTWPSVALQHLNLFEKLIKNGKKH
jgi:hypothetical protein